VISASKLAYSFQLVKSHGGEDVTNEYNMKRMKQENLGCQPHQPSPNTGQSGGGGPMISGQPSPVRLKKSVKNHHQYEPFLENST